MKKLLTMALCIALLCVMALPAMADEPISIVYPSYQVGVDGSATYMDGLIQRFNEAYAGKYEIVVEEIPGQQDYIEKLKLLNSNDELPVLFDLGADPTLAEMIIADDKLLDLSDVILNDADWMSVLIEESVEFNTVNGKLIAAPAYQDSYSGVWYNKEVFANAGVDEFPTTWDGLLEACEKIKATGVAPIALMTNGSGRGIRAEAVQLHHRGRDWRDLRDGGEQLHQRQGGHAAERPLGCNDLLR